MKKWMTLLLSAVLILGLAAGCTNNNTQEPDTTTEPQTDTTTEAPTEDDTLFEGILDMTDDYTLVIETPGTSGDDRIGVRAPEGKVQVGQYNKLGSKRTDYLEFDWADLGLDGECWEYLGATMIFDTTGDAPVLTNQPEKCTWLVPVDQLELGDGGVALPGGKVLKYTEINNGIMRPNSLINEGGAYVMGWNDFSVSETFFNNTTGYYVFTYCERYDQAIAVSTKLAPYEVIEEFPEDPAGTFSGVLDMTNDYTLVIETPGTSGDDRIGVQSEAGMVQVGKYNRAGMERIDSLELDWADLGLEGEPWEYLGATFEFDTTGDAPVLTNAPEKSTFICAFDAVTLTEDSVVFEGGQEFAFATLHYGRMRPNSLINEGGKFATGWDDLSVSANYFTNEEGYYVITVVDKYNTAIVASTTELPAAN